MIHSLTGTVITLDNNQVFFATLIQMMHSTRLTTILFVENLTFC